MTHLCNSTSNLSNTIREPFCTWSLLWCIYIYFCRGEYWLSDMLNFSTSWVISLVSHLRSLYCGLQMLKCQIFMKSKIIKNKTPVSNLFSHLLCRRVAQLWALAALGAAAAHVAQQVGVDGVCQLAVGQGQLPRAEGLGAGVVGLLTTPLQRHQQLLQRSGSQSQQYEVVTHCECQSTQGSPTWESSQNTSNHKIITIAPIRQITSHRCCQWHSWRLQCNH